MKKYNIRTIRMLNGQDRQCTYNVTLRRFLVTIVLVESNTNYIFRGCVCSFRYPACNAHGPYCRLWPAWLYNIFSHYLIRSTIFERTFLSTKYEV